MLSPLRQRDFRLLWAGMCVSLTGDGVFIVALAWQVYALSNAPTALAMVGIAMTLPTLALLLVGGVLSDRLDRRRMMLAADIIRALAVAAIAALSLTGQLELWHLIALVIPYAAGNAFFGPAFDAIVPDVVAPSELAQANALDQFVRPLALRLAGPALGGVTIEAVGVGAAFALNAASFAASAGAVLAMSSQTARARDTNGSMLGDIRAGLDHVRRHVWLWGTLTSAALAFLLFMGPIEILLPFVIKNELGGNAADLGLVFAAGGVGSAACAAIIGRRGLPRRNITLMYAAWTLGTLSVAGYGIASAVWQLMLVSLAFNAFETVGLVVWSTAKQRHVPPHLLGRVSSLDWLISTGLLPLSLALTGPVSVAVGAQTTLIGAGILGALVTLAALTLPGIRAPESRYDIASRPHALPAATR
jgi:DHA3 family tetracycline resistance protein-like MFS transporter